MYTVQSLLGSIFGTKWNVYFSDMILKYNSGFTSVTSPQKHIIPNGCQPGCTWHKQHIGPRNGVISNFMTVFTINIEFYQIYDFDSFYQIQIKHYFTKHENSLTWGTVWQEDKRNKNLVSKSCIAKTNWPTEQQLLNLTTFCITCPLLCTPVGWTASSNG